MAEPHREQERLAPYVHGYPIVSRPEEALDVFERCGLTHLGIQKWLVEKR